MSRQPSAPPPPNASLLALLALLGEQADDWRAHARRRRAEGGRDCPAYRIYRLVVKDLEEGLERWRAELLTLDEAEAESSLGKRQLARLADEGRLPSEGTNRGRLFPRGPLLDYVSRPGAQRRSPLGCEDLAPSPAPSARPDAVEPRVVPRAEERAPGRAADPERSAERLGPAGQPTVAPAPRGAHIAPVAAPARQPYDAAADARRLAAKLGLSKEVR